MWVGSIRPAVLKCVVRDNRSNHQKISNVKQFNSYMFTLQSLKQTGYELLVKKYTNLESASKHYVDLMNPQLLSHYEELLGLKITEAKRKEEDSRRFDQSMVQILNARNKKKLSKGIRLVAPEDNEELTKEDLQINEEHSRYFAGENSRGSSRPSNSFNTASLIEEESRKKANLVPFENFEDKLGQTLEDRLSKKIKTEMYVDEDNGTIDGGIVRTPLETDRHLSQGIDSGASFSNKGFQKGKNNSAVLDENDSDEEAEATRRRTFIAAKVQARSGADLVPTKAVGVVSKAVDEDFGDEFA